MHSEFGKNAEIQDLMNLPAINKELPPLLTEHAIAKELEEKKAELETVLKREDLTDE